MKNSIFLFVFFLSLHCKQGPPLPSVIVERSDEKGGYNVTGRNFATMQDFEACLEKHLLLPVKDRGEVRRLNDSTMTAAAFQNLELWPGLGVFEVVDGELTRPKTKQPLTSKRPSQ